MKKVLLFPFLRMPSGHHQAAEAVIHLLNENTNNLVINKMDFLSYTSNKLERLITHFYLKWIRNAPGSYEWVYQHLFNSGTSKKVKWYHYALLTKMSQLLEEEKPDLIICTHGFPSLLLSFLKQKGKLKIPVVNVYTDFFINNVWGMEGIDAHFVPNQHIKERLINDCQILETKILVTGIPVHGDFQKLQHHNPLETNRKKILVSGGSSGLGSIVDLLNEAKLSNRYDYIVLCGNNQTLYQDITSWEMSHIYPVKYLSSRQDMNALYNQVDAIITKPGGITISEALQKRLPIFIHSALPGQEEINLRYLKQEGLVCELNHNDSFERQIAKILDNEEEISSLQSRMERYCHQMDVNAPNRMFNMLETLLNKKIPYVSVKSPLKEKIHLALFGRKATTSGYSGGNTH